jgi:hypothetical protein
LPASSAASANVPNTLLGTIAADHGCLRMKEFVTERNHKSKNLVLVGHAKDDGECMSNSRELCLYLHDCVASTWLLVIQLKDEYRVLVASDVI